MICPRSLGLTLPFLHRPMSVALRVHGIWSSTCSVSSTHLGEPLLAELQSRPCFTSNRFMLAWLPLRQSVHRIPFVA